MKTTTRILALCAMAALPVATLSSCNSKETTSTGADGKMKAGQSESVELAVTGMT